MGAILTAPPETGYPWMSIPAAGNSGLFASARYPSKWIDFFGNLLLNLSLLCSMAEVLCQQTGLVAFHDLSHKMQPQSPSSPCKYQVSFTLYPEKRSGVPGRMLLFTGARTRPCPAKGRARFGHLLALGTHPGGRRGSEQGEGRGEQIVSRGILLSTRRQLLHPGSCLPSRRCLAAGSTRSPQYCHP